MRERANVTKSTTDWHQVNWRAAYRQVRNLRRRIFKATEEEDWRKVRNLQRLMLRSYSNALLAVRRATQENAGKKTAGVDRVLVKTSKVSDVKAIGCRDIRELFLNHRGKSVLPLIARMNPIIRGKANYMKPMVSSEAFADLEHYLFIRQSRYAKRTHPGKNNAWKRHRYWGNLNLQRPANRWVFGDKASGAYMLKFSWFKIERHRLVRKRSSPDDPSLQDYWKERNQRAGATEAEKLGKIRRTVAKKQDFRCPVCKASLFNGETVHLHHLVPKCEGGGNEIKNLV